MKEYYIQQRQQLINEFGGKCQFPDCIQTTDLEFAHIKDTDIKGYGLSGWARLYDARKHPASYLILCRQHHEQIDHHKHTHTKDCYICSILKVYGATLFP